jgi:hypothetical protein
MLAGGESGTAGNTVEQCRLKSCQGMALRSMKRVAFGKSKRKFGLSARLTGSASVNKTEEFMRVRIFVRPIFLGLVSISALLGPMASARADGPKLIHTQSVQLDTPADAGTCGPVGPNCSATTCGTGCVFFTESFTTRSKTVPFGPSTGTGTFTLLFGVNGAFVTPSGGHDASGNPTGICAPQFATETSTFSDGSTITQNYQATRCCASNDCISAGNPFGPPTVVHFSDVITGGTGRFAGATGVASGSAAPAASGAVEQSEGVLQLP